ncbi:MAG: YggS family pyridoxal phosphate-dependent enzyme [Actinomycetota bacterium]|nr:YggS family pyridoxal phosphate-dependent enzyme [Actinomycetota bacterium]
MAAIRENISKILDGLPDGVQLVAAAKRRRPEEIMEAVDAGVKIIGESYIKEAKNAYKLIGGKAKWHYIGIPQIEKHDLLKRKNLKMFNMIQTIDSMEIAEDINRKCAGFGKVMPILIEVNSGKEPHKFGVLPERAVSLVKKISTLSNVKIMGLMTMGPRLGDPEKTRPYFKKTREIFERIKKMNLPGVEMKYLSMGMTNSYKVALQEGANIVRVGNKIFGKRK